MTKNEFHKLWALTYPKTVQISHLFKHDYSDRWFRIHSLPQSKRYADNENEWAILLSRQNTIITDLFGLDTNIFLVTGEYDFDNGEKNHIETQQEILKEYSFTQLDTIDLYNLNASGYIKGTNLQTSICRNYLETKTTRQTFKGNWRRQHKSVFCKF